MAWDALATLNGQPLDADLTAIAAISPTNDDVIQRKSGAWVNRTPAQLKTDLALTKTDVGLSSVDNTTDLAKPVSTATTTALNALDARLDLVENGYAWLDDQSAAATTTSASYTATLTGGTAAAVAFGAPPSGAVTIHNTVQLSNSSAGQYGFCTIVVRAGATIGSGTVFLAESDANALVGNAGAAISLRYTVTKVLVGLTPGALYNVQQMFKTSGGTETYSRRSIAVVGI